MAVMNMVSAGGFSGVSFYLRRCPQGGCLCILQANPHFWVPMIKVRQPDGIHQNPQVTASLIWSTNVVVHCKPWFWNEHFKLSRILHSYYSNGRPSVNWIHYRCCDSFFADINNLVHITDVLLIESASIFSFYFSFKDLLIDGYVTGHLIPWSTACLSFFKSFFSSFPFFSVSPRLTRWIGYYSFFSPGTLCLFW
jgi:hypothetical protein